jgi:hypothetical protein
MRMWKFILTVVATITTGTPAVAWDPQGHQLVGAIADQMLNANARQQVALILGYSLQVAAPWPDCVRSIVKEDNGKFDYLPSPFFPEYRTPCTLFEGTVERDRMADYAKRNWVNCANSVPPVSRQCHAAYHFADVPIQRGRYDRSYAGTSDHDVVSAINAAIAKLQDQPVPAPFSIKDKKEALFMLAHFVGDLHQPLHVGAVYLGDDGTLKDPPDPPSTPDPNTETVGGNSIQDGNTNLHSDWDKITETWGPPADAAMLADAATVPATPDPIDGWAASWASDTVIQAQGAFNGLAFSGPSGHWTVKFPDSYDITAQTIKRKQLAKAGARLAQLLNKIWP